MGLLMFGLVATGISCLCVGLLSNWAYSLVAIIIYVVLGVIVNKITKHFSNKYLKQGHFMLGLICRSENNRVFLHHNVEVRPGYLGKWVEFLTYDDDMPIENILEMMRDRWHKIKYSEFLEQELERG
jgi:hypothetical protein